MTTSTTSQPGRRTCRMLQTASTTALALLLAACVSVPQTRADVDTVECVAGVSDAGCQARIAAQQAAMTVPDADAWEFQGRAALSGEGQGGNARIEWSHQPARDEVVLSAPVTRQSWRLEVEPAGAVLHGMPGGPRSSPDAAGLLREATRWEIPVPLLRHWVRGGTAPQAPVTRYLFARGDGALAGFDQAGWRIEIAGRDAQGRPIRLNAEQPALGHRVRLVIDHWGEPAP